MVSGAAPRARRKDEPQNIFDFLFVRCGVSINDAIRVNLHQHGAVREQVYEFANYFLYYESIKLILL